VLHNHVSIVRKANKGLGIAETPTISIQEMRNILSTKTGKMKK
jgi:hypothetical protein